MKRLLGIVLLLASMAYPFWAYAMLHRAGTAWIMLPLAGLWLLRAFIPGSSQPGDRLLPMLALAGCLALALIGADGVRWYPVFINGIMLALFGSSLRRGRPVIERIARLQHPDLPATGVRYTRKVTQVWTGFFLCNGLTAAALALWAPWSWWAAYTGFISYILIGLLFAGEWLLRPSMNTPLS
jgi:uncharacterized membrane protein